MALEVAGYRLDRLIGRGRTGEVWLAWDRGGIDRPVALKRLGSGADDEAVAALRAEAALLDSLDHPHLLGVIDVVADGPDVAQVLPLARGGSLRDLLDERGTLAAGEVAALLAPVADAVESLHRVGLVHGDLKPENILLTSDGAPLVADLGAARELAGDTGHVFATPAYLDPDRHAGGSARSTQDVYALGVIAYEALCGRLPHRGDPAQVVALAAGGVHRRLETWPGIEEAVAAVIEAAIDPNPVARPAGPVALANLLAEAVPAVSIGLPGPAATALREPQPPTHETVLVRRVAPTDPEDPSAEPRWHTAGRSLVAVAVLVLAALAVVALAALGQPHSL